MIAASANRSIRLSANPDSRSRLKENNHDVSIPSMVHAGWPLGYHNIRIKPSYLPHKLGKYNFFHFPETYSQNPTGCDNILA